MGRDYYCVVIRDKLEHELDNKHCISLNYEPDYKEKVAIEDNLFDNVYQECKFLDDLDEKHTDDFCQLCRWFLEPACFENEYVVVDYHSIRLPDFRGNYFLDNVLYPSKVAYEYNQEGGSVYWITKKDLDYMEERIKDMPEPQRSTDKQQFEQTQKVVAFLNEWIKCENVKILYFTEC